MKIAFDENMPMAMLRTFQSLAKEKRFQRVLDCGAVVSAKDYTPLITDKDYVRKSDVPWMRRYKEDGGRVIISGDVNMPDVPHQLLAIRELGMVIFFFPAQWNGWSFYYKSALLLVWWERIIAKAKTAEPGEMYHISKSWNENEALRVIGQPGPITPQEGKATPLSQSTKARTRRSVQPKELATSNTLLDLMEAAKQAKDVA